MKFAKAAGLAAVVFLLGAGGCIHTGFTPTTGLNLPPRPQNCYLDMIFQGLPPYPHVIIGQVSTDSTAPGIFALGESNDVAVQRMKEQACLVGAHGLMKVDASSQGVWNGDGISKSTSGGAVAFVYVDPQGRPLSPPTAPRIIIQPGAYPNPAAGGPTQASWAPPPPQAAPPPPPPPAPPRPTAASPE
jgi:hypothetical protein